jgi:hypothetical protein
MDKRTIELRRIERSLDNELQLDARQRVEVHQIILRSHEQLKGLCRDCQPQLRSILGETRRNIASVLTPEQQQRFETFLARHPLPAAAIGD